MTENRAFTSSRKNLWVSRRRFRFRFRFRRKKWSKSRWILFAILLLFVVYYVIFWKTYLNGYNNRDISHPPNGKDNLRIFTTPKHERLQKFSSQRKGTTTSENHNIRPSSQYAYAFIIGGMDQSFSKESSSIYAYKGFLWNILLSVKLLMQFGSTADFVVFWQAEEAEISTTARTRTTTNMSASWISSDPNDQMTNNNSESFWTCQQQDLQLLKDMGIHIMTPLQFHSSPEISTTFVDLMFEKFQILQLDMYRRVLYLDADIMPISNLDYLFHLSDMEYYQGRYQNKTIHYNETQQQLKLQPNILQASGGESANGGLFVVEPSQQTYQRLLATIERQRKEGLSLPYPNFSKQNGWGHSFQKSHDEWHGALSNGTNWDFHGSFADQGLLYYFFKYELKQVSIIIGNRVENWGTTRDKSLPEKFTRLEGVFEGAILDQFSKPYVGPLDDCKPKRRKLWRFYCYAPYRDFIHLSGVGKPWQQKFHPAYLDRNRPPATAQNKYRLWFLEFLDLTSQLSLFPKGSDWQRDWNEFYLPKLHESPLGYFPLKIDNHKRVTKDRTVD